MEKRDARKLSTEAQQELREMAIRLRESGQTYKLIAQTIQVQASTVCAWYKAYERGGKKALKIKKRGRPSGSCMKLTEDQGKEVQKTILRTHEFSGFSIYANFVLSLSFIFLSSLTGSGLAIATSLQ